MSQADPELLGRLLDEHGAALELFARQWCASPEDVVQDAFITLARQTRLPCPIVPWLYCVVRNGAISARRSAARRWRHEAAAAGLHAPWFAGETSGADQEAVARSLAALPLDEREVIVAHVWGGLTFQEIGALSGVSASTAHRRYESGLTTLKERLGAACLPTN